MRKTFAQKTLDDSARRRAFWIVAPLIVGVVVALATLAGPPKSPITAQPTSTPPPRSSDTPNLGAPATTTTAAPAATTQTASTPPPLSARDRSAVMTQAKAFLSAFLRYEVGRGGVAA